MSETATKPLAEAETKATQEQRSPEAVVLPTSEVTGASSREETRETKETNKSEAKAAVPDSSAAPSGEGASSRTDPGVPPDGSSGSVRRRRRGCRDIEEFELDDGGLIGQGTYGQVMVAHDKQTGEKVALKKIKLEPGERDSGFPILALREILILKRIRHDNVIRLKGMVTDKRAYRCLVGLPIRWFTGPSRFLTVCSFE